MSQSTTSSSMTLPSALLKPNSEGRAQLLTHFRLLHLFHHRSKNQHRRSYWYRHFNALRTQVKALCGDLAIDLGPGFEPVPSQTVTPKAKSNAKFEATGQVKTPPTPPPTPNSQVATRRLTHIIATNLVPHCYTAFSSLAAIPSFTPLALTLLAILARIAGLTGLTAHYQAVAAGEQSKAEEQDEKAMGEMLERFAEEDAGELFGRLDTSEKAAEPLAIADDLGVPVIRSVTASKQSHDNSALPSSGQKRKTSTAEEQREKPLKKRKKAKGNDIDALFEGL